MSHSPQPYTPASPFERLERFLLEAFEGPALHDLVRALCPVLECELPPDREPPVRIARQASRLIERHGLVNNRLWQCLIEMRPARREEIESIETDFMPRITMAGTPYLTSRQANEIRVRLQRSYPGAQEAILKDAGLLRGESIASFDDWFPQAMARDVRRLLDYLREREKREEERGWLAEQRSRIGPLALLEDLTQEKNVRLQGMHEQAMEYLELGQFESAKDLLERIIEESRLIENTPEGARWQNRSLLNLALCGLLSGQGESARLHLQQVEPEHLSDRGRLNLARFWALLGETCRARSLLPQGDTPDHRAVCQHIDLSEGIIPEELEQDGDLELRASMLLIRTGDARRAASLVYRIAKDLHSPATAWIPDLLAVIDNILALTLLERVPTEERASREQQAELLLTIDRLRKRWEEVKERASDKTRQNWARANLSALAIERRAGLYVLERARLHEPDPEVPQLPGSPPQWWQDLAESLTHEIDGDCTGALLLLQETVVRWPRRPFLEYTLAKMAFDQGRYDLALEHARISVDEFPASGHRLLLARCLATSQDAAAVWEQVTLIKQDDAEVMHLKAWASLEMQPDQAPEICASAIKLAREPGRIAELHLFHAFASFKLAQRGQAAEAAWAAFQTGEDLLSLDELIQCAGFLLEETREGQTVPRIHHVLDKLRERFPQDPRQEAARLQLLRWLGEPADFVDMSALVSTGHLIPIPASQTGELVQQARRVHQNAMAAWYEGEISFKTLAALTGRTPALTFSAMRAHGHHLSTPQPAVTSAADLHGKRLLLGWLEVLLLAELELFDALDHALGPHGRIVLFQDIAADIERQVWITELDDPRKERDQWTRLDEQLSAPNVQRDSAQDTQSDESIALEDGFVLVTSVPQGHAPWISPRALRAWLVLEQKLPGAQAGYVHVPGPGELPVPPEPPRRLLLKADSLRELYQGGALEVLLALRDTRFRVSPSTSRELIQHKRALMIRVHAAELAARAHGWLGSLRARRRVETPARPRVDDLPGLRPGLPEEEMSHIEGTLSFQQALLTEPELWLLAADLAIWMPATLNSAIVLAWDEESFLAYATRRLPIRDRILTFPQIVRAMDASTPSISRSLARMGFSDALGAGDLIELSREYCGLKTGLPREILDGLTWRLGATGSMPWLIGQLVAFGLFSASIVAAYGIDTDSPSFEEPDRFLDEILSYCAGLDDRTHRRHRLLERVLTALAMRLLERQGSFIAPTESGGRRFSQESPSGRLWGEVISWTQKNAQEETLELALVELLRLLDANSPEQGPSPEISIMVSILIRSIARGRVSPAHETAALLCQGWSPNPLKSWGYVIGQARDPVPADQIVREIASRLSAEELRARPAGTSSLPEAPDLAFHHDVLLHSAPLERVPSLCEAAMHALRNLDGTLAEAASAWAADPLNAELRRTFGRRAARSPYRRVCHDPASIASWEPLEHLGNGLFPCSIVELRELLSEPGPLPQAETIAQVFHSRLSSDLDSVLQWLEQLLHIPGGFSVVAALEFSIEDIDGVVDEALRTLESTNDIAVGDLAVRVMRLRRLASFAPVVRYRGHLIDLREELPRRLRTLLDNERKLFLAGPSLKPEAPYARLEPAILRLCAQTVETMAQVRLPDKDYVYLSWRLYGWFVSLLHGPTGTRTCASLASLLPIGRSPERCRSDAFDPFRQDFGRRPLRMLVLLNALLGWETLAIPRVDGQPAPVRLISEDLATLLIELLDWPPCPDDLYLREGKDSTVLPWNAPITVPDLALNVLLLADLHIIKRIPAPIRVRLIGDIPPTGKMPEILAGLLLLAESTNIENADPAERALLARRYDQGHFTLGDADLLCATALHFVEPGDRGPALRARVLARMQEADWQEICTFWLLAEAQHGRLEETFQSLLDETGRLNLDPVPVAQGLGRVVFHGDDSHREAAVGLLERLEGREPFARDSRMAALFRMVKERL